MGVKIGLDMKVYLNTGTYGTPVWSLNSNVKDLKCGATRSEGNASTRANEVEMMEPTMRVESFDWNMIYDPADAHVVAIETAFYARSLIELAFADGPIATSGTRYRRYEVKVFDLTRNEPLGDIVTNSVVVKPCYTTNTQGALTVVS